MNKLLLTILTTMFPLLSSGQLINDLPQSESGNLNYNDVIQLESKTKDQLYLNSKQFFVDVFKSAQDVIQMDDKDAGIVIGKGFSDTHINALGMPYPVKMWYTVKIQSKDGRYKYEIYNIYFEDYPPNHLVPIGYEKAEDLFDKGYYFKNNGKPKSIPLSLKDQMNENTNNLRSLILESMSNSQPVEKNSVW